WRDIRLLVQSRWIDIRELEYQIGDQHKVVVYRFRKWNQALGDFEHSEFKATREFIEHRRCEPVEGSEEYVEPWEVDAAGRYQLPIPHRSVSDVMSTTHGYGFNILGEHRRPEVTFEYFDQAEACSMRRLMNEAVGRAVRVTTHSR